MKAYVLTTGIIFVLVTIAHLTRMVMERHVLSEPVFLLLTIVSASLAVWSAIVFRRLNH